MTECINKMKNDMKINDWNAISADFDLLHKLLEKAKQIIAKEGIPKFYFKALLNLDAFLQKTLADKPVRPLPLAAPPLCAIPRAGPAPSATAIE